MKKVFTILSIVLMQTMLIPSLLNTSTVRADDFNPTTTVCSETGIDNDRCPDNNTTELNSMIGDITRYTLIAIGALSAIFLIYGGILFVISSGNPDKVKRAKNTVLFSLIGLALAILANIIIGIIINTTTKIFN